jgi:hypothetical protein
MSHRHHVAALGAVLSAAGVVAVTTLTAGAAHADRNAGPEVLLVHTIADVSPFTSGVLADCASGTVANSQPHVQFNKPHGMFNGFKVFSCDGGSGGFTLHLSAQFVAEGSLGSWAVTDSWGTMAGLHGDGNLVGIETDQGIDDHYFGTLSS